MRRAPALLAVIALLIAMTPASVPAAGADPQSQLDRVRSEISSLGKQITQAKTQGSQVAKQVAAAQRKLDDISARLTEAEGRVKAVQGQIADREAEVADLQSQITVLTGQLTTTRLQLQSLHGEVEQQAIDLYMSSSSLGTVVLGFSNASQLAVGLAYADDVLQRNHQALQTFEVLSRQEERDRAALSTKQGEVNGVLSDLQKQRTDLQAKADEVTALRTQAAQDASDAEKLLAQINATVREAENQKQGLEADANRLEQEIKARQSQGGTAPGKLAWPVRGPITSPFGWRIHPIYGTRLFHTGIDIGVPTGTHVHAADGGTVLLAGRYGGYGNAVVLDHGGGLSTVYGHLERVAVSVGQHVSQGQLIGYSDCTGLCTGPHLHFEVRVNGSPVDPMKYLSG